MEKESNNGISKITLIAENLINQFKENKFSINIEQCRLIIDYLLIDRELDEDYVELLEKELEEKE